MADGIPDLPDGVDAFVGTVLMVADALGIISPNNVPQWGIFLNGEPVVIADNVVSFEFDGEYRLSKYPQEQGAFATYNKVATPITPVFRFSAGGSLANRTAFLASIEAIAGDLNLYDVVTPEAVYSSYNIVKRGYRRVAEEANLIIVDIRMEQVVIAGAAAFTNTTNPSDTAQQNNGLVQGNPSGTVTRGADLPNISGPVNFS
jgi:hypothetical protein